MTNLFANDEPVAVIVEVRNHGIVIGSMAMRTFHTTGLYEQLYSPLVSGYPVALYAPKEPAEPVVPTASNIIEACKATACTGIPILPIFIEVITAHTFNQTSVKSVS